MPLHPTEGLFLTPLSGVTEAYLPPDLTREIETARSLHLTGQVAIKRKFSYFSKIWHFKKCHLGKMSLKRKQKHKFLIICLFLLSVSLIEGKSHEGWNLDCFVGNHLPALCL